MKRKITAFLLAFCIVMQMCAVAVAAPAEQQYAKETLEGLKGVVVERSSVDSATNVFSVNFYAYGAEVSSIAIRLKWNTDIIEAWDTEKNMAAKESAAAKVIGGFEHMYDGDPTDVFKGNLFIPLAPNVNNSTGIFSTEIGLNPAGSGTYKFWEGITEKGRIIETTDGYGFGIAKIYFHVKDGHTAGEITTDAIYLNSNASDSATYPSGVATVHPDGTMYSDYYLTGFPAAAKAPTNVVATPAANTVVTGESTTVDVSADVSDSGTLSYAVYENDSDSNTGGTIIGDFTADTTLTFTPAADKYYYVVARNTKVEDGETTTADAASETFTYSFLTGIESVSVNLTAPEAGQAQQDATVDSSANYTVKSTTWDPAEQFVDGTNYAVTVVLQAKTNFLFKQAALAAIDLSVAGKSATEASLNAAKDEMTFKVDFPSSAYAQNVTAVAAAKTKIEAAMADKSVKQADMNTEAALKKLVQEELTKLELDGVTATVSGKLKPAATGTWDKQDGTDGAYTYTVKLSKGTVAGPVDESDKDTDYKATGVTAELSVAIKATAFKALKEADGVLTLVPDAESIKAGWSEPAANVPVDHYLLTVTDVEADETVGDYSQKDIGAVTDTTITGLELDLVVTKYFKQGLLPNVTYIAKAAPAGGEIKPITMTDTAEAVAAGSNEAVYENGRVVLTRGGMPQAFDEVRENFMVCLFAQPDPGYKFDHWERSATASGGSSSLDEAELFSFEDTTVDNSTDNPLYLQVSEASSLKAVFAEVTNVVPAGDPKLQGLDITAPVDRHLIRDDMTEAGYDSFSSTQNHYTLYLTKDESKFAVQPYFASDLYDVTYSFDTVTNEPYNVTTPAAGAGDQVGRTGDPVELTLPADSTTEDLTITVTEKNPETGVDPKTTTYTVTIVRVENNPQMMLELDAAKGTKLSSFSVRVKDAVFEAGDFSIKLDEIASLTPEAGGDAVANAGFASFADPKGEALSDGVIAAADVCENISSLVSIDKMEIAENGKMLNLTMSSKNGSPITFDNDGAIVFKFYLLQNDASSGKLDDVDLIKTVKINNADDSQKNTMQEKRFSGGLDYVEKVETDVDVKEEDRLVYLKVMEKYTITAYVSARPDYSRVHYSIFETTNGSNKKLNDDPIVLESGDKVFYKTGSGTYKLVIQSNGFLPYEKDLLKIDGARLDLDAITLIAGDVNGDGVINATDRALIVKLLDSVTDDDGASKIGEQTYYADFNDDSIVNAKDLGKVIRNIVATAE